MLKLEYGCNPRVLELRHKGYDAGKPGPDLRWNGDTDEVDGFTYTLSIEDDDWGMPIEDFDMALGTITEHPEKRSSWKIDPDIAHNYTDRRDYYGEGIELYWNPMEEIEALSGHYHKAGASKQVAREMALASEKAMMKRRLGYGDMWNYAAVSVTVSKNGVELGSASVGGVESDCDENGHLEELVHDLASEALPQAKATLKSLCGGVDN
jgi:hypothetical protein